MRLTAYIARWPHLPFGPDDTAPWLITTNAPALIRAAIPTLGPGYRRDGETAIHASAQIEPGATIKGPAIIGPNCFIAASALLRGGVFLDEACIIGPAVELKTTFMFRGSKAAHLNFIGDSLIGADVNLEAGSIVANYRNELDDQMIRIRLGDRVIETGVDKFGALIGDGARIGANAVIAPGAVLSPGARVPRLGLVDQWPVEER
jgi:bifunctional N-acetylglucosamine-1-phosphate-uridyltransferase/glucosamine-1-phosphate-acetyltransferase GlmU-like protein